MNTFKDKKSIGVYESEKIRMSLQSLATLCFVSVLLLSGSHAQDLDATMDFLIDFVVVGSFADATCSVIGLESPQRITSIMWQHNGTEIVPNQRITISRGSLSSTLGIVGIAFSDAGEYTCSVVFENPGTTRVASDTLRVATPLSVVADPEQEAFEGETATLLCTASSFPSPRIKWFRIFPNSDSRLGNDQLSTDPNFGMWKIQNVQDRDAGIYRCEGSYNFDSINVTIELVVLIAPEIISDARINFDVDKGDDLVLDCNATGIRDPVYTWFFNGNNVTELESERIQVDEITGILIVQDTVFFDYGNYTCLATNEAGNDTQENIIRIQGTPEIVIPLNDSLTEEIVVGDGRDAELRCNFIAYPPASTRWFRVSGQGGTEVELSRSADSRYEFGENGTFVIRGVVVEDVGLYRCLVFNVIDSDTRMHRLRVIEFPAAPTNLTVVDTGPFSVTLEWIQPPPPALNREVDGFVAELSIDGGMTFEQSEQRFSGNATNGTLVDLTPGLTFYIRLRAFNMGGPSDPTNHVEYTSDNDVPRLDFFNATAQEGGRSVLLEWELEYDGGLEVDTIRVQIFRDGIAVNETRLPIASGRYLIMGLDPITSYTFHASVSNSLGGSEVIISSVITTGAPPNKPTTPAIISISTRSLTFSFSVEFGSSPILFFLLNITEHPNGSPNTFNISVNDTTDFIQSLVDIDDRIRGVFGHTVEMRVSSQLNNQNNYVFAVAAENEIGVGEFSDASDPASLHTEDERTLYYIIAGVVGGVLLVVVLILLVIMIACCKKKISKRKGGKMNISYGAPPDTATKTDEFVLQSPPPGKSAVTNNNYQVQEQSGDPPSPYYNSLSKFQNGGNEYTKQDTQIDVPDSGAKFFKYNPRPVANPSYNDHTPSKLGQPSPKSPYQASLPRSLTNEGQGNDHAVNKQYPESVVSDKHFPLSPIHVSSLKAPLSRSTPVITDRYSDSLPKMATSYQTDV